MDACGLRGFTFAGAAEHMREMMMPSQCCTKRDKNVHQGFHRVRREKFSASFYFIFKFWETSEIVFSFKTVYEVSPNYSDGLQTHRKSVREIQEGLGLGVADS